MRPIRVWMPWVVSACLLPGCSASPPVTTVPIVTRALESAVSLGLGQRDFTMTLTRNGKDSDKIHCLNYTYDVKSPRDAATGQASGKRQHAPVVIIKEWDASSPVLMQILVNNEVLKSVKLEFSRNKVDSPNFFDVFTEISLANVSVTSVVQTVGDVDKRCANGACTSSPKELEEISLTCQKASFTNRDGGVTAEDSWVSPK
ncbi:MAG: type secretion system effector, Hcp1 family [Cyanobacteria bacterium RYN_339]|nr:type secretion system effector, Hcp1 family [Cyanobacteria bacterium RYN_339]